MPNTSYTWTEVLRITTQMTSTTTAKDKCNTITPSFLIYTLRSTTTAFAVFLSQIVCLFGAKGTVNMTISMSQVLWVKYGANGSL